MKTMVLVELVEHKLLVEHIVQHLVQVVQERMQAEVIQVPEAEAGTAVEVQTQMVVETTTVEVVVVQVMYILHQLHQIIPADAY
jgi:hypothetical protein